MFFLLKFGIHPRNPPDLPEASNFLQFGTSSTRAGAQDDVSSNKPPQMSYVDLSITPIAYCSLSVPDGLIGLISGHLRAYQARRWDDWSNFKRL